MQEYVFKNRDTIQEYVFKNRDNLKTYTKKLNDVACLICVLMYLQHFTSLLPFGLLLIKYTWKIKLLFKTFNTLTPLNVNVCLTISILKMAGSVKFLFC